MITRDQAIRGAVFVHINPVTGMTDFWFAPTRTEVKNDAPKRPREFRSSGVTKTWKREPHRFAAPTKYDFRSSHTITEKDAMWFELLAQYEARQRYGFHVDTPTEVIADKVRDEEGDAAAEAILCLPKAVVASV